MNKYFLTFLLSISLISCTAVKESAGLGEKQVPDEFSVIKRAPLQLPPEYTLRPPTPGAKRPQEQSAQTQAKEVLFKEQAVQGVSVDNDFLKQLGTDEAKSDIRTTLEKDQDGGLIKEKAPIGLKLLGIQDDDSKDALDPIEEYERLKSEKTLEK